MYIPDLFIDWKKGSVTQTDSATIKQGQSRHTQMRTVPVTTQPSEFSNLLSVTH